MKVNVRGNIFNVILVNVENMESEVSKLKGANITFYGPLVKVKGARIVLAKATVAEIMEDMYTEPMKCMHKKGSTRNVKSS